MDKAAAIRAQAKGELVYCEALPAVMTHGWNLQVVYDDGRRELILGARDTKPKWFGDAMTMLRFVQSLGFDNVKVHVTGETVVPQRRKAS
ncbi:MAG: hypothetical protein RJS97_23400 [Parvibaculaceae bacterium]